MTQDTIIKSESTHFAALFFRGCFEVPWHQRRYDWKKDHVETLLHDIYDAMQNDADFYFLGQIVLIEQGASVWGINDGQQRMTTYSLICACFLRLFADRQDSIFESQAMRVLFKFAEHETRRFSEAESQTPRLTSSQDDKPRFESLIRGNNVGTNGKLTQAWGAIDKFVYSLPDDEADKYFKFLTEKVEVSFLTLPKEVDPNRVFETLNYRGKPLGDFDLMRNFFYSFFNDSKEINRRAILQSNLDEKLRHRLVIGSSDKTMEYARSYLQCRYGFLPKEKFYRHAREHIEHGSAKGAKPADYVFSLVNDMANGHYAEIFNAIARPEHSNDLVENFNKYARQSGSKRNTKILLDELRTYTITQPILLALLSRYFVIECDNSTRKRMAVKIYRQIKMLNAFVMRTALVERKFEPSLFEKTLAHLACEIFALNSMEELSGVDILSVLKDLSSGSVLDDEAFVESLTNLEIKANNKASAFLFAVNAQSQSDADAIQRSKVTVEHILPKASEHWDGWRAFKDVGPEYYVHRIGNLTLLSQSDAKPSKKDNASWKAKKPTLGRNMFALNKNFASVHDWMPEEVEKRQKELAQLAAKIWSFE